MNKLKLHNYFNSHFDLTPSSNGWYRFDNPFIDRYKTMAVNFDYGYVKCFRSGYKNSCVNFIIEYSGHGYHEVLKIVNTYTELKYKLTKRVKRKGKIFLPDHYHTLHEEALLSNRARQYLAGRGLDLDYLDSRGIGFCNKGKWGGFIIFPFMNPSLYYYIGGYFLGKRIPKYENPKSLDVGIGKSEVIYNEMALNGKKVYVTEGIIDALCCGDYGVATLGWALSKTQKNKFLNSNCEDIYICQDRGFTNKTILEFSYLLSHKKLWISNIDSFIPTKSNPMNDVNDVGFDNLEFERVTYNHIKNILK